MTPCKSGCGNTRDWRHGCSSLALLCWGDVSLSTHMGKSVDGSKFRACTDGACRLTHVPARTTIVPSHPHWTPVGQAAVAATTTARSRSPRIRVRHRPPAVTTIARSAGNSVLVDQFRAQPATRGRRPASLGNWSIPRINLADASLSFTTMPDAAIPVLESSMEQPAFG